MKKVILLSVLTIAMLFNAGCTDEEITAGAIGVIIGIGLGDGHHHHDRRPAPYRPVRPGRRNFVSTASITLPTTGESANVAAADFALKHNISMTAAEKVQTALNGVKTEGLSSLAKIGLNKKDIETLMKHDLPSSAAIKSLATKLDMSEAQSRDLLISMNREFEAQAADIESPYWESCMAKGKWRTPQNLYCKSTNWNGCSPEMGATLCY
ncbi:hypothetical protein [Bdellovibrio svalbardensis]|uniref:Lipoprotein n=1 Tax=Bdellovibrio svalbardensis TaxID=2972972 RepID=A0ABT6DK37_9BACT|nr:hypothetical protein [Bdellovibrio svalbardensis]MDG0817168.1 hypothetical protein [Bdellovibrio svalbardensis]